MLVQRGTYLACMHGGMAMMPELARAYRAMGYVVCEDCGAYISTAVLARKAPKLHTWTRQRRWLDKCPNHKPMSGVIGADDGR